MPNIVRALIDSARNSNPKRSGRMDWRQAADIEPPGNWWDSRAQRVDRYGVADGIRHVVGSPVPLGAVAREAGPLLRSAAGAGQRAVAAILGGLRREPGGAVASPARFGADVGAISDQAAGLTREPVPGPNFSRAAAAIAECAAGHQRSDQMPAPARLRPAGGLTPQQQAQFESTRIEQAQNRSRDQARAYMDRGLQA